MASLYTTEPSVDFAQLAQADATAAEIRKQSAINAGMDEKDAEQLYIMPVQKKWQIINSDPGEFDDPKKIAAINADFDAATVSAIQGLSRFDTAQQTANDRFSPLVAKWTMAKAKVEMPTETRMNLMDLRREMNRLESQRATYGRQLTDANLDAPSRDLKTAAVHDINEQLKDLKAEYEAGFNKTPAAENPVIPPMPASQPIMFSRPEAPLAMPAAEQLVGTGSSEIFMPAPAPFEVAAPTPVAQPKPKNVIFIAGRPDLSNVTREEADAAWAARFNQSIRPPAASRDESIESDELPDEVIRLTRDGKKAVFDAKTKRFLRFTQ